MNSPVFVERLARVRVRIHPAMHPNLDHVAGGLDARTLSDFLVDCAEKYLQLRNLGFAVPVISSQRQRTEQGIFGAPESAAPATEIPRSQELPLSQVLPRPLDEIGLSADLLGTLARPPGLRK